MVESSPFCPSHAELHLVQLAVTDDRIVITAVGCRDRVACPACGVMATRVHSRYPRTLADLPWQGTRVQLAVTVRRFFCDAASCARRIFAERLPVTAARYARRTGRAASLLELLGFALGGRAGARLGASLGVPTAPGTVLTRVRAAVDVEAPTPRVLGVDDFAFRRGQRYGTVLVDLERRRVIDLLPDREAATFAAWLRAHPGVAIISRDRGGAYAEGGRQGAPDAVQIADRFHLVHNLVEALETACTRHHAALQAAAFAAACAPPAPPAESLAPGSPDTATAPPRPAPAHARDDASDGTIVVAGASPPQWSTDERAHAARRARRIAQYDQVVALRAARQSKHQIARVLGLARSTVARWLAAGQFPERATPRRASPRVDPYAMEIAAYYDAGGTSAMALLTRLQPLGYQGSHVTVWRALHALQTSRPAATEQGPWPRPPAPSAVRVPSPRQTAWLLRTPADARTAAHHAYVTALTTACPSLAEAEALGDRFVRLLREHDADGLEPWLAAAEASELRGFARGLRRDLAAVLGAITSPWSNGQVEGQVHRIKLVKRTMFGHAKLDLLRARLRHVA